MNFGNQSTSDELSLDINITSLIDIVLCLLFFFMVTASFINASGIQVNLPKASSQEATGGSEDLSITINAEGRIFSEKEPLSFPALTKKLIAFRSSAPQGTLIVRADTSVSHGKVVEVLDAAKSIGLERIAIATVR